MAWLWTFGSVPEVEPAEMLAVSQRIRALPPEQRSCPTAPRIIDVRTRREYDAGYIPGALHASFLPPWAWPSNIQPLLDGLQQRQPAGVSSGGASGGGGGGASSDGGGGATQAELYVICLSAHRSIGALKWLRERGFTNVKQLKGGMQAWRAQGLVEVTRGEGGDGGDGGGGGGRDGATSVGGSGN